MTSAKQIKHVFKPLINRHADLTQIGSHWLYISPIRHVALRILIDRTSDKNLCKPQLTMLNTFIPDVQPQTSIGYSIQLDRPSLSHQHWYWSDPEMIADLVSAIETEGLPRLRAIDSLEAFWTIYDGSDHIFAQQWPEDRMICLIALGDIDAARAICETLEPELRGDSFPNDIWVQNRRRKFLAVAEPLRVGDRVTLATILHGWEADNIRGTKLEPYWEPTPFPLERSST